MIGIEVDKSFLESCSRVLCSIDKRDFAPILFDHKKEINYLKAKGLISGDGSSYVVEPLGRNWIDTFQFESMIADLENNKRLLDATEQSALAAKESAKSAKDANVIANKALERSDESIVLSKESNKISSRNIWISAIVSIVAAIIGALIGVKLQVTYNIF